MAEEMVKSALVQEGVSRAISFVLGKRKERPSQEDMMERMERLEMAVNEVESVVERTAKMPITGYALINRRKMLKRAYMEGADLLSRHHKHQQAAAALALQNEGQAAAAATFSTLARRWVKNKVSSISSLFGWNKSSDDLSLSCDDIRRYERFADFARNFLRDLESGYTLRHYTFCNPLVRYLLEGTTLTYQLVQWNIKRYLHIMPVFLEDRGVTAQLFYEYLDYGRREKSFRLEIIVQVSESTDIIAVGFRCLEAVTMQSSTFSRPGVSPYFTKRVTMQSSTVFLETAKGELTRPTSKFASHLPYLYMSLCRLIIKSFLPKILNLSVQIQHAAQQSTDNHGYRTCPFPDHQVMYFKSVGFSRRLESDSSRSSSDEASTSVVRHPPTPYNNIQICTFDFVPHFDKGFAETIFVEVLGAAQNYRYESPQEVVHMELPEGLTSDPFFSVRQEIISFRIGWVFQHGGVRFEWKTLITKIASKPNGSQCKSMDSKAKGKALQHEEEEKESFPFMLSLATDNQLARLRMAFQILYNWSLERRECMPITARYKAEHFLSEPGFFRVGIDDLNNLLQLHSTPGVGLIGCWTLYMMAKHNKKPVGFLNPQLVCEDTIRCDVSKVEEYVTKAMLHHQDKIHILAPYYFHQSHWILIVIVLEHSTVLYLDFRNNSLEKYRLVTELIDRSFAMYISNKGGDTPRQTTMKHRHLFPWHRQPDNRINSGYYVCHHMQEIIIRGANKIEGMKIPTDQLLTSEHTYIQQQLATFLLSSVINKDGEFRDPDRHYYTNELENRIPSPVRRNLSDDYCPKNYECGKFMLPLGQLVEEPWETRRFHRWYMVAAEAGLRSFIVRVPKEAFKLAKDSEIVVDFYDMDRMLRRKDLDIAQVTLFALMQYHICKEQRKTLIYLSPMEINQRCITGFELPDDATDLKGLDMEERQQHRKAVRKSLKDQVATYIYKCMKSVEEHGCLLAPYCFGGHWITFLIYPQHGSTVVLDSLNYPKESYEDFESVLNLAYKMYIKDHESIDIRSEQNKAKYGHNIAVRHNFPCAKQPPGTLLCGFYTCEYLKESEKFSINYSVLMNSERWGERRPIDEMSITRTIADICEFIMHNCVHQNGAYFDHESDLARDEKYENIRNWDQIHLEDYKIADL